MKSYNLRAVVVVLISSFALQAVAAESFIRLATTTSTDNSGLLGVLLPPFEQRTGHKVQVIAVGTGKALRLAREGDVDVVLVHARQAEAALVAAGFGDNRRDVMFNDFVIVGPKDDAAGIRGSGDAVASMSRIAETQSLFLSRGDDSGTHKRERQLWQITNVKPESHWYREAGQGMGKVLQMSAELGAYTLVDRGTWLALRNRLPLEILVEGDERLFNPYGVIAVNPARYPDVQYEGAMRLIAWLTSPEGQSLIGGFLIDGQPLFTPSAIPQT